MDLKRMLGSGRFWKFFFSLSDSSFLAWLHSPQGLAQGAAGLNVFSTQNYLILHCGKQTVKKCFIKTAGYR